MNRVRQRLTAWIASIAILMAALAPTLAQALVPAGERATPWSDICSANGKASVGKPKAGGDNPDFAETKHCPWCFSSHYADMLPSADHAPGIKRGKRIPPAELWHNPYLPTKHRGISLPRAPPVIS